MKVGSVRGMVGVAALWLAGFGLAGGEATSLPAASGSDAAACETEGSSPICFLRAHDREVAEIVGSAGDTLGADARLEVTRLINAVFDFEELSHLTLGRHWDEATPDERRDFVRVYRGLVEKRNFDRFVEYYQEGSFEYRSEEVSGDSARVMATVPLDTEEMAITYLLRRTDDGWSIYDLIIDGTSTAKVNGRSYVRYLRRHSYAELVARLEDQLARLEGQH